MAGGGLIWLWQDDEEPDQPSDQGRYHGPPNPPRDDRPRYSPVMAVVMLAVGAQQTGLAYAGNSDATA